jgi:hypothetical protein
MDDGCGREAFGPIRTAEWRGGSLEEMTIGSFLALDFCVAESINF